MDLAQHYFAQDHAAVFFFSDGGANTKTGSLAGYNFTASSNYGVANHIQSKGNSIKAACDYILACVYKINEGISSGQPTQKFSSDYMILLLDM